MCAATIWTTAEVDKAEAVMTDQRNARGPRRSRGEVPSGSPALFRVYKSTMRGAFPYVLATTLGVLLWTASLCAHHSFAAEYDAKKPVTLNGTVTKVEWTNPHVRFHMNVKYESGVVTEWEFTMGAVNGLLRRGWKTSMLKPDDAVIVDGYLARDGSHLANARIVTLSDGRKMSGGTMPDASGN